MENNNLEIWDQVSTTEKAFTKETSAKGYACTSINPNYIYKKLTSLFGPCGIGWGYKVLHEEYREGQTAICKEIENREILHVVQVAFWYEYNGKRSEDIPAFGQTFFVRVTSGGWKMDEEAPKKSLTDALTKAASMIGVSADIFSGKWDGNKNHDGGGVLDPPKNTPAKKTPPVSGVKCPKCDKEDSIIKSKFKDGEFVCYNKKNNGCGFKFTPKPPEAGDKDDVPIGEPPSSGEYISANDQGKIFAKARSVGWSDDDVKALLDGSYGIKSTKDIPVDKFEEILGYIVK